MSDIGNINAIREWSRRYFYTKEDINYFVTKLNEGYKGYALTFVGPRNKKVTVNPNNYIFTLNSDGWYRHIFFFSRGQEITIEVEDGETITYQLDEYNDTINLSPYVIATDKMTSIYQPSGYIMGPDTYVVRYFDRDNSTSYNLNTASNNYWVTYELKEKMRIYKADIDLQTYKGYSNNQNIDYYFIIQGSNNNSDWEELGRNIYTAPFSRQTITIYINDPKEYLYYRLIFNGNNLSNQYMSATIYQIYYYTINQSTVNYGLAIPRMTSNTVPSGVCSASSLNQYAYFAFDQESNNSWYIDGSLNSQPNSWIQYKFPDNQGKIIKKIEVKIDAGVNNGPRPIRFTFLGSNDGTNFTELADCVLRHGEKYYTQIFYINNSTSYTYYRLKITNTTNNSGSRPAFDYINMYEEV